ncbi:hypothetical protein LZZ90_05040 [Flavobacterium sp. SM15]|uniref:hypothetical protein n=1 Tax=Flavobacterium sp. SM15 TaxID=2908005 RepID=UPI001EDB9163|nr:hypothetical protein [Flavobacterium sp. SM15]MCG2610864.1 hypothetical protein [Flavobacterium sp. SM15]
MLKKTLFLLCFLYSCLIFGQNNYYLEGKLGKSSIYLSIEVYDSEENSVNARYFYQNSLKDIVLEGTRVKGKFILFFKDYSTDKIIEKFELTSLQNKTFKGFWSNATGKKTAIELQPIDFSKIKANPIVKTEDSPMNKVKLQFLNFKKDSASVHFGKKIDWYSEKHCKMSFFRLSDNFSLTTRKKINPMLNTIQVEEVLSQLECSTRFAYSEGSGIDYSVKIGFLNKDLLGFEMFRAWDCGGAHPDFGGQGYLIDLNTGKNFDLDQIIAFDKSVTSDKDNNFSAYSEYRTKYFAPKLFELINESQHFKKPENSEEDGCDYTDLEIWNFVSWNFTKDGIEFTPYFYRAARNCEEPFLIPFDSLKKYKNPTFPYTF